MSTSEARCVICAEHGEGAWYVAGPRIMVCSKCIHSAASLALRGSLGSAEAMQLLGQQSTPHCSFCGRLSSEAPGLIGYGAIAICPECLGKSVEIIATRAFEQSQRKEPLALPPHGL